MLGVSVYLSQEISEIEKYLNKTKKYGVKTVFTSIHIGEDKAEEIKEKIKNLADIVNSNGQDLMVDISTDALVKFEMTLEEMMTYLIDMKIRKLRLDYGFDLEQMKQIGQQFEIILNASTIDEKYCIKLSKSGIDLSKITVCHNFYPRPDTGLSHKFLLEKNKYFKEKGFKVQAFIPGDEIKRGPLMEGLPTLENHRYSNLLASYIELKKELLVDEVLIGDISATDESLSKIDTYEKENIVELSIENLVDLDDEIKNIVFEVQENRKDYSDIIIRSSQTRLKIKTPLDEHNTIERKIGTITLDNKNYSRYNGEMQITLMDLPRDEKVNVIGNVVEEDLCLLKYIKDDVKFRFVK